MKDKKSWSLASNGKSENMQVWGTNSGWFQLYKYDGETFFNVYTKKVLDVEEGKDQEGQNVRLVEKKDKAAGQKWKLLYVD